MGGFPEGRVVIVAGPAGSAKTVLAGQFLAAGAASGQPGVFVTMEESADDLRRNLSTLGFDIAAWEAAGGALVGDAPTAMPRSAPASVLASARASAPASAPPYPDRPSLAPRITIDDVALQLGRIRLIDARAGERFRGEVEPLDAVAGHIPGALNRCFKDNLGADGRFKSPAALRAGFAPLLGAEPAPQVVHQCGSGVTACHNLLAMEHAGLHGSALYVGSWSEWSSQAWRPVASGG